ncbi:MAG: exodeoxyribonuclease III [Candidatus Kapaibacteriales bacterium]
MKKIISWNINGYRSIVGQNASRKWDKVEKDNKLFRFIERENPDILMLQETKAAREQINPELQTATGYKAYYSNCRARKGYSGTAIFTKEDPDEVFFDLDIEEFDCEGRLSGIRQGSTIYLGVYFPNGGKGEERIDYKLRYYDALFKWTEEKRGKGYEIVVSGDYNTAHKEIDLARPKENINTSGFLLREREKLDQIVEMGYTDSFRMFENDGGQYTWWAARGRAKERNVGWRIDYHFLTPGLVKDTKACYHLPDEPGSDHCPIILELED